MDGSVFGLLVSVGIGLGVALAFWGLTSTFASARPVDRRLAALSVTPEPAESSAAVGPGALRRLLRLGSGLLTQQLRGIGAGERIARDLIQADLRLSVGEFVIAEVAAGTAGLALGLLLRGDALTAFVGAAVGWALPGIYVRRRRSARIEAMTGQLGHTLMVIANALRAGSSLLQSLQMLSREMPEPTATEFGRVVREVGLGLTFQQALWNMLQRVPSYDLELVIIAITIQYDIGGNLAPVLDSSAETIRERIRMIGEVKALTAQQTYSGYLLAFLPVGLVGILHLLSPGYIDVLFQPGPQSFLLVAAGLSLAVGFVVIQRLVRVTV